MPEILRYQPGSFCWTELQTVDVARTSEFYSALFAWTTEKIAGPSGERTITMQVAGKEVAALRELRSGESEDIHPQWFSYVSVLDVASSAARALQFGGEVVAGVSGHSEDGLMAVIRDPVGAMLGLWQPGSRIGARLGLELNTVCWTELASRDPVISAGFYSGLFGWAVREERGYMEYVLAGVSQAGMVMIEDDQPAIDSQWNVYFRVSDCDAAATRASDHGGSVLVSPTDVRGVGRFSRLCDPLGAVFSVIRLEEG